MSHVLVQPSVSNPHVGLPFTLLSRVTRSRGMMIDTGYRANKGAGGVQERAFTLEKWSRMFFRPGKLLHRAHWRHLQRIEAEKLLGHWSDCTSRQIDSQLGGPEWTALRKKREAADTEQPRDEHVRAMEKAAAWHRDRIDAREQNERKPRRRRRQA